MYGNTSAVSLKYRITSYVLSVVWFKFFHKALIDWTFTSSHGRLLHGLTPCVPASLSGDQPIHFLLVTLSVLVNPFCIVLILSILSLLGQSTFQMLILFYLTTCLSWLKVGLLHSYLASAVDEL